MLMLVVVLMLVALLVVRVPVAASFVAVARNLAVHAARFVAPSAVRPTIPAAWSAARLLAAAVALLLAAAPARADSPRLAEARRAVEAVDYDAARRLLVEALRDGGNSPAAVREIYRLSARAAVVLGERDLAEQYYRLWLAIDPDAALPGDTAPKLREPFVAAQSYIAAHGRLRVGAQRVATGEIDVELLADPLAIARAAAVIDPAGAAAPAPSSSVAFGSARRLRLPAGPRIAILDDRGNHLLELEPGADASGAGSAVGSAGAAAGTTAGPDHAAPPAPRSETPPWTRRWLTWAVPTAVFVITAAGFGVASLASYDRASQITRDSGNSFQSEAQDNAHRGATFAWITAGATVAAIGCAIPTTIYFSRNRSLGYVQLAPVAGADRIGLALGGRY
jgi:hypothetical protein